MIQGDSNEKELNMESNIRLTKEHVLFFCKKNEIYKSYIIRTPSLPTLGSPWSTSRGATFSISFLTCEEARVVLTIFKFKALDPFL